MTLKNWLWLMKTESMWNRTRWNQIDDFMNAYYLKQLSLNFIYTYSLSMIHSQYVKETVYVIYFKEILFIKDIKDQI
jgi:hypothetical protein